MTTTVLPSAGAAPAAAHVPLSTFKRIDRNARAITYWSLVGFGVFAPLLGGLAGLIKALVT
jgi:hypothetical protein